MSHGLIQRRDHSGNISENTTFFNGTLIVQAAQRKMLSIYHSLGQFLQLSSANSAVVKQ
jgi:hypothetical protein